jgi:hypothetical protein
MNRTYCNSIPGYREVRVSFTEKETERLCSILGELYAEHQEVVDLFDILDAVCRHWALPDAERAGRYIGDEKR